MANFDLTLDDTVESFEVEFGEITYITNNDFNKLNNRPSYADEPMTGETNIPEVNDGKLEIQKNGTTIGKFSANQSSDEVINLIIPTVASDIDALPNTTKYGADLSLTIDSSTYVMTVQLKDQNGNNLGEARSIDLPLESMVVGGSYDAEDKAIILTLKNGETVEIPVADLVSGLQTEITEQNKLASDLVDDINQTHKFATAAQLTKLDELANIKTIGDGLSLDANGKLEADGGNFFTADATTSGTGTSTTLNNTLPAKLDDVKLDGDTTQQTYSGKNLFNSITASNNKVLVWTTGNENNEDGSVTSDFIAVTENTQIRSTYLAAVFFYDSSKNLIGHFSPQQQIITTSGGGYFDSFTVPSSYNIAYMRLGFRASQGSNPSNLVGLSIMINTGNSLLPYEPYVGGTASPNPDYPQNVNVVTGTQTITISDGTNSQNYTVDLGSIELCKIGTHQDYIYKSGDDWYVHKACGKSILGGLSWTAQDTNKSNVYRMKTDDLSGLFVPPSDNGVPVTALSTHFTAVPAGGAGTYGAHTGVSANHNGVTIQVYNPDYNTSSSAAGLTTWLSNNNVTLYYQLATPTDTKITDNTLIGELNALYGSQGYDDTTILTVSATDTNLPAILEVSVFVKSLKGIVGVIGRLEAN